ncbi:MAG TPA: HypC/HybG/HupF family hydrogenase formation chaperone [Solirubrobacteraceae bacterium]|nr:HypC/HybG/HupF family hydrogenase formation chaperone [Solirubrobacteraceae bacterium]
MCLAIPGQIVEMVDEEDQLARVEVAGVRRTVNVGLLEKEGGGSLEGEWVLIHVGFALSRIDEEEALATLGLLERMGAEYEQELRELAQEPAGEAAG